MWDGIRVGVDILATRLSDKTKRVIARIGDAFTGVTESDNAEVWQHVGLVSRPPKPVAGKQAAQGVSIQMGDREVIIASCDTRGLDLLGNLRDGETSIYAAGGDGNSQGRILLKDDGSISIFTRDGNTADGKGIMFRVGADGSFSFVSPLGAMTLDSSGWMLTAGGKSVLKLGASGSVKLQGNGLCEVAGKITCVGTNCTPTPASYAIHGPTGMLGVPSKSVFIGT